MNDDIEALRGALAQTQTARRLLENEIREERLRLMNEVEAKLSQTYGARLAEVKKKEMEARVALSEAEVRLALIENADMYQGILFEWERVGFGLTRGVQKTGRRGKYEIRTRETVFPGNRQFGLPEMGEHFIRLLKKDGSPGLGFVSNYWKEKWLPEGQKPEVAA